MISIFLSVSSPKVTGLSEYLSVSQGGKFKLKCKVAGSPTPKVTWLKDGRPLRNDIRISIKNKRFVLDICLEASCQKFIPLSSFGFFWILYHFLALALLSISIA